MHPFVLHNDEITEASATTLSPGQVGLLSGWGVFSTIRVAGGVLFAWERHWERMHRDAAALRVPFPPNPEYIRSRLLRLVRANGAENATLRVVVVRNCGGMFQGPVERDFDLIAFTTGLKDWGTSVSLTVRPQARHAACPLAGTKMLSWAFNLAWLEEAQERGFDEVILLNERGEICECTSANLFISQGSQVWTPPLSSGCLPGITRELLLTEVSAEGITTGERTLFPSDLEAADEVFITSSTRDLLPVRSVEGMTIRRDGLARRALAEAFQCCLQDYVARPAALTAPE